ncbi:hypothetical protein RRG08_036281 [Elysia crispata]|uniref:Uncharacterized protein n=1 Tax=Elysia crispata TaxID=231223 RepID=A0AAE0ZUT4_9GAST|nr:hypothetical protein RRG08_036281 [Elysia crispata]
MRSTPGCEWPSCGQELYCCRDLDGDFGTSVKYRNTSSPLKFDLDLCDTHVTAPKILALQNPEVQCEC